jgi:hypothetical protein
MAKEQAAVAGGAEVAHVDIFREKAGSHKLRAIGFAKIEMDVFRRRLVAGGLHVEPLERIGLFAGARLVEVVRGIAELRGEFGDKVGGDFVAARTDRRANRGKEIGGFGVEFELHPADGLLGDPGESAAPTGMNGGNSALFWVYEEDRDAIGGLDAEQKAGTICDGSVALRGMGGGRLRENANHVRVDLLERNEFKIGSAERGLKEAAIFEDVFARVPFQEAEIEDFFRFKRAYAAGARAEAV